MTSYFREAAVFSHDYFSRKLSSAEKSAEKHEPTVRVYYSLRLVSFKSDKNWLYYIMYKPAAGQLGQL